MRGGAAARSESVVVGTTIAKTTATAAATIATTTNTNTTTNATITTTTNATITTTTNTNIPRNKETNVGLLEATAESSRGKSKATGDGVTTNGTTGPNGTNADVDGSSGVCESSSVGAATGTDVDSLAPMMYVRILNFCA